MKIKFESHSLQEAVESVPGYIALLCLRIVHESFSFVLEQFTWRAKYVEFECMVRMGFHHAAAPTKEKIGLFFVIMMMTAEMKFFAISVFIYFVRLHTHSVRFFPKTVQHLVQV